MFVFVLLYSDKNYADFKVRKSVLLSFSTKSESTLVVT